MWADSCVSEMCGQTVVSEMCGQSVSEGSGLEDCCTLVSGVPVAVSCKCKQLGHKSRQVTRSQPTFVHLIQPAAVLNGEERTERQEAAAICT